VAQGRLPEGADGGVGVNAPLSEQQLAAIRAREAAAFRGPWYTDSLTEHDGSVSVGVATQDDTWIIELSDIAAADAEFIAAARSDVPALLAEVERLRAERDQFADRVDTLTAVAKGNKRHVQAMFGDLQTAQARIAELEQQAAKVAEFVAARAEVITAIRNCHPDNAHDYHRWQGHAESRRQLAETLGLPVAWPEAAEGGEPRG
jgi:hypothetical protein